MDIPQSHCRIETLADGTVTATSDEHRLIIRPVGEARAFNRNGLRQKVNDAGLPGLLNKISASIRQEKITVAEGWQELRNLVDFHEKPYHERWLVGELNGVRVYIRGNEFIMTTEDLYP